MEQHDTRAVSDGHGSPDHAHTPTAVFPEKSLAEGRRSRWADKEVFKHWFHAVSPLWSLRLSTLLLNDGSPETRLRAVSPRACAVVWFFPNDTWRSAHSHPGKPAYIAPATLIFCFWERPYPNNSISDPKTREAEHVLLCLHGADSDDQLVGDGTIGFALGHQARHLALTGGQSAEVLLERAPWRKRSWRLGQRGARWHNG